MPDRQPYPRSQVKGVSWNTQQQQWHAQLDIGGKLTHIGLFPPASLAAAELAVADHRRRHASFTAAAAPLGYRSDKRQKLGVEQALVLLSSMGAAGGSWQQPAPAGSAAADGEPAQPPPAAAAEEEAAAAEELRQMAAEEAAPAGGRARKRRLPQTKPEILAQRMRGGTTRCCAMSCTFAGVQRPACMPEDHSRLGATKPECVQLIEEQAAPGVPILPKCDLDHHKPLVQGWAALPAHLINGIVNLQCADP